MSNRGAASTSGTMSGAASETARHVRDIASRPPSASNRRRASSASEARATRASRRIVPRRQATASWRGCERGRPRRAAGQSAPRSAHPRRGRWSDRRAAWRAPSPGSGPDPAAAAGDRLDPARPAPAPGRAASGAPRASAGASRTPASRACRTRLHRHPMRARRPGDRPASAGGWAWTTRRAPPGSAASRAKGRGPRPVGAAARRSRAASRPDRRSSHRGRRTDRGARSPGPIPAGAGVGVRRADAGRSTVATTRVPLARSCRPAYPFRRLAVMNTAPRKRG